MPGLRKKQAPKTVEVKPEKELVIRDDGYGFRVMRREKYSAAALRKKQAVLGYWWQPPADYIFECNVSAEATCCGFPVVGNFVEYTKKLSGEEIKHIAERFVEFLSDKKRGELFSKGYYAAYVPDLKDYEVARSILVESGWKPQVSLRSNHGRYTNTRWEWYREGHKMPKQVAEGFKPDEYLKLITEKGKSEAGLPTIPV